MELTRLGRVLPNIHYMLDDLDGGLVDCIRTMVQEGLKLRVFNNVMSNSLISWIVQQFLHCIYLSVGWVLIPCLKSIKSVVPNHIAHHYSKELNGKSFRNYQFSSCAKLGDVCKSWAIWLMQLLAVNSTTRWLSVPTSPNVTTQLSNLLTPYLCFLHTSHKIVLIFTLITD